MYKIVDKILLFLCGMMLYLFRVDTSYAIIPAILSILLSCLFLYFDNIKVTLLGNMGFLILCILIPEYIIFSPVLLYDLFRTRYQLIALLLPVLYLVNREHYNFEFTSFLVLYTVASFLLKHKTDRLYLSMNEYNELRDSSTEVSLLLKEKNQSLLKNQDYEINLATLNERNRISKEIHDSIGHLLSKAILQVGALLTITKDKTVYDGLSSLKDSLSDGMDQIRSSIHQMHDESIDLFTQINQLVKQFSFCPVHFDYNLVTTPPSALKHSFIAIVKEALANIMKHSHATKAAILLREHPVMYQLVIQDNGNIDDRKSKSIRDAVANQDFGDSMGLRNITDRVKSFQGNINISLENGFQIFITIPKEPAAKITKD